MECYCGAINKWIIIASKITFSTYFFVKTCFNHELLLQYSFLSFIKIFLSVKKLPSQDMNNCQKKGVTDEIINAQGHQKTLRFCITVSHFYLKGNQFCVWLRSLSWLLLKYMHIMEFAWWHLLGSKRFPGTEWNAWNLHYKKKKEEKKISTLFILLEREDSFTCAWLHFPLFLIPAHVKKNRQPYWIYKFQSNSLKSRGSLEGPWRDW